MQPEVQASPEEAQVPEGAAPAARPGLIRYLLIAAMAFGVLVPLTYAYLGTHARYLSDDLCRASHLQEMSIWRHQTYLYNNEQGRFSFSFLISVTQSLGPWTVGVIPVVMIVLWLGACTWTLRQLGRLALGLDSWLAAGALDTVCVFASLAVLPDRLESLYWLTGNLTYMPSQKTSAISGVTKFRRLHGGRCICVTRQGQLGNFCRFGTLR